MWKSQIDQASKTPDGYTKLPSGLIIQWGRAAFGGDSAVIFPIPFPNAVFSVTTGDLGGGASPSWIVVSPNSSGFSYFLRTNLTVYNINTSTFTWQAIGY